MDGFTREEKFLSYIATKSFLQFWSWSNLFRDQFSGTNEGKEISDLSIIFGSNIILFSDKKIKYNKDIDKITAWNRWFKKAIINSAKQALGAKRWIQKFPNRVFLDSKCTKKLPIVLNKGKKYNFHLIVVTHGLESELNLNFNETSFIFDNSLESNEINENFTVSSIYNKEFIHIFNEYTIELVLNEFNTTKDFLSYLSIRKSLLSLKKHITVNSETDIINFYFKSFNEEKNSYEFNPSMLVGDSIQLDFGGINNLFNNPYYITKKVNDEISYFWDDLIESFSFHILNNTIEYSSWKTPNEIEPSLRKLAENGRFERRALSINFHNFYNKIIPDQRGTRVVFNSTSNQSSYLFFALPHSPNCNYKDYRKMRRQMLEDYCDIKKLESNNIKSIVGIGFKSRDSMKELDRSFFNEGQDFIFIEYKSWGVEDINRAEKIKESYIKNKHYSKTQANILEGKDFPDTLNKHDFKITKLKGKDRNKKCICGSGKKYKYCCGK